MAEVAGPLQLYDPWAHGVVQTFCLNNRVERLAYLGNILQGDDVVDRLLGCRLCG